MKLDLFTWVVRIIIVFIIIIVYSSIYLQNTTVLKEQIVCACLD